MHYAKDLFEVHYAILTPGVRNYGVDDHQPLIRVDAWGGLGGIGGRGSEGLGCTG